jgi:ParB family chromosome partitioning protein
MARKSGLGKGLEALIPRGDTSLPTSGIIQIPVGQIEPNPRQPRAKISEEALGELTASIREHGIIQPVIVHRGRDAEKYYLIAGERRWRAARLAGLQSIPAMVKEATEQQKILWALIENVQRTDLSPLEAAEAYRQLNEDFGLSHAEIAIRVGKSRATITNTLRLFKLPLVAQQTLAKGQITEGHARALLSLSTVQAQAAALQTILTKDLSVRQAEKLVQKMSGQKPTPKPKPATPPEINEIEEKLQAHLGTKVRIARGRKGGRLIIHYYSDEELNALIDHLVGDL